MLFNETSFIGIDPTAGKRPMAYAALDRDLSLIALGEGDLDAVTAFVAGQQSAYVAVNAPPRPNQGDCIPLAPPQDILAMCKLGLDSGF